MAIKNKNKGMMSRVSSLLGNCLSLIHFPCLLPLLDRALLIRLKYLQWFQSLGIKDYVRRREQDQGGNADGDQEQGYDESCFKRKHRQLTTVSCVDPDQSSMLINIEFRLIVNRSGAIAGITSHTPPTSCPFN
jgi:hypothetical protein